MWVSSVRAIQPMWTIPVIMLGIMVATVAQSAADDRPTAAARRVAEVIRREALLPPNGPAGRPLPLASHWNFGTVEGTFGPDHQIGLIQQGHHILPWIYWPGDIHAPNGEPDSDPFRAYYDRLLTYFAELNLPISLLGTQWNGMLLDKEFRKGPESRWAGVITPNGKRENLLSPFGAIEPWRDPAQRYVNTPPMKRVQELYPDPPLVLLVSNNEPRALQWAKDGPLEKTSKRYLERYGKGRSDEFKRKVVAMGWMQRYPVMFAAMREALVNDSWRERSRFIAYNAFGPRNFGQSKGWMIYSLITDQWTDPHWYYWDGGSPAYYTNNWSGNRDDHVFSSQVQAMNWVFMLEEAWHVNPNFWFELSTWDGNYIPDWMRGLGVKQPEDLVKQSSQPLPLQQRRKMDQKSVKRSKALQYMQEGQAYPPERTAGWVQFGMWLLRPRVVREFRLYNTPLKAVEPYWMETVKAVDRVHANKTLTEFWRYGQLVPNQAHPHPYQSNIPERYKNVHRWYLLDTNLDPKRPWKMDTNLPVFSLALIRVKDEAYQWLLYAHSPVQDRKDVQITVPYFGRVIVDVPQAGAFYLVEQQPRRVTRLNGIP